MRAKRKPAKKPLYVKPCKVCEDYQAQALVAINVREKVHSEQMRLAVSMVFELLDQRRKSEEKIFLILADRRDADESLARYVQSFDAHKAELRAILDRGRDGRFAAKDLERMGELVR